MLDSRPISGYNLPPGCFEHDIDAYFGEGKPTCAECAFMLEYCCDYGICRREYQEAFDNELGVCEDEIKLTQSDGADWALEWIPDHMRDMHDAACEHFLALQRIEKAVNHGV